MSHYTAKQLQELARRHQVPNRSKYRRKELLQSYLETYWGEEKFHRLVNEMNSSNGELASPPNKISQPIGKTSQPDNKTSQPENKTIPSANKTLQPANKTIPSANKTLESANKTLESANKTTSSCSEFTASLDQSESVGGDCPPAKVNSGGEVAITDADRSFQALSSPILYVSSKPRLCPLKVRSSTLDYLVLSHASASSFFPLVDDYYSVNELALNCPRETVWVISGDLEGPTKALGSENSPFALRFYLEDGRRVGQDNPLPTDVAVVSLELQPLADPAEIGYEDLLEAYAEPLADGACFIEDFMGFLKSLVRRMREWHYQPAYVKDITKTLAQLGWSTDELLIMKNIHREDLPRIRQEWLEMPLKGLKAFGPLHIFLDGQGRTVGYLEGLSTA
jgi:hypothetical protein